MEQNIPLVTSVGEADALSTLLCFVLIERHTSRHAFCSRYDFGPWPLLQDVSTSQLDQRALAAVQGARAVMLNGFVFDELRLDVVTALASHAHAAGAAVFFDLGAHARVQVSAHRHVKRCPSPDSLIVDSKSCLRSVRCIE